MTLRLSLLAALLLTACANDAATPWQQLLPVDHAKADAAPAKQLAFSRLILPLQANQNDSLGFDLDNKDGRGAVDNKLGAILQLVQGLDQTWDMQGIVDAQVTSGRSVLLAELRTAASDPDAVIHLVPGHAAGGQFMLDPTATTDPLYSIFQHGELDSGEAGTVLVDLALTPSGAPIRFRLVGAHIQMISDKDGKFHGHLGGGIPVADMQTIILPAVGQRVVDYATANPGTPATAAFAQIFDTNRDGSITLDEFLHSNAAMTVASPDVDLFTDSRLPSVVLGSDGTKDCVSAGLGFDAVPATF